MWYSASLFYSGTREGEAKASIWMETLVLIEAENEDQAKEIASNIGKGEEHQYKTIDGAILYWLFEKVERIQTIEDMRLKNGVELFSRFLRPEEAESLLTPFDDE